MKVLKSTLIAFLIIGATPSWACSYEGQVVNPFTESYPGSLDVVIATQKAVLNQHINKPEVLEGPQGLQRAVWWLKLFVKQNKQYLPQNGYIYLADSHLWSSFSESGELKVHSLMPENNERVLVTSEFALSNVISEKISYQQSQQLGMILVQ